MYTRLRIVFIVLYLASICDGARILGVFPMAAPSHYFLGSALLKGLAEAGHDITIISPFANKDPPKNGTWREIVLEELVEEMKAVFGKHKNLFDLENMNTIETLKLFNTMARTTSDRTLGHSKVQKLIKSNEKFDVVIITQFLTDSLKALAVHFDAHLILFSNIAANTWLNPLVGNPSLPSFHPEVLLGMPKRMNFFQRVGNTLFRILEELYTYSYLYPQQNEIIKKYFPNTVDINDVLYNVSLVLVNSHVSISHPQPLVPCIVEIGGFHLNPPKKLPEDLQKYLDDAKEGVIYFSMGSNLQSKLLPAAKRDAFLKAFAKRKEKILWKWEDDVLPGQPPNVKLGKWLPQQDILAHPNVKAFITHGGLLSTTETVYHGVPIVAIPIAGDQTMNAIGAQEAGYGIVVSFKELTEEKLTSVLDEIITNPKYRENVKERSRIMKDRPVSPIDTTVYWVEYVIRHNGAKHLRVAYLDLAWYQFYMLDVFAFILVVLYVIYLLLKKAFSCLCKRKDKQKLKQN